MSEKDTKQSTEANLIFGTENGGDFQDSFEGTECFGCSLRKIEHE